MIPKSAPPSPAGRKTRRRSGRQRVYRSAIMASGELACAVAAIPQAKPEVLSSLEWLEYFAANAERCRPIPWETGAGVTPEELDAIARSLQAWQLGETSDGRHLRAAAACFA